jgi:dTDP-4-amino-4,6-dideoxygalactose transaminase
MGIPLVDLKSQYLSIKVEIDAAVQNVLNSGAFIGGKFVEQFEKEFASFCKTKYAVGVASGTDALYLGLRALGLESGDEVITSPFTFIATAEAIERSGAACIFADIDGKTYNISPAEIEKRITRRTRVILPVHIFGQTADMDAIKSMARKRGLIVFEDAAQAHGALWNGRPAGSLGRCTAFSFYPSKNLGADGDGGAFTTDSAFLARKVRLLRDHGRKEKYLHSVKGINSRLDAVQAAILSVKLRHLSEWNRMRRQAARLYSELLSDSPDIITPHIEKKAQSVFHVYAVRVPKRDKVVAKLNESGIGAAVHYPLPVYLQGAFRHLAIKRGSYPVTERVCKSIISLPIYPEITPEQVEFVAETLKRIIRQL